MQTQSDAHPLFHSLMPFVVGLLGIQQRSDGLFDVLHMGSGTLFEIGGIHGVLTAGHVVKALQNPAHGFTKWAIISFSGVADRTPLHHFPVEHAHSVRRGDNYEAMDGPDIGFIRLPSYIVSGIGRPFFSITARYKKFIVEGVDVIQSTHYALLGVIGERSDMVERLDNWTKIKTVMMVAPCLRIATTHIGDDDYDTFLLVNSDKMEKPASYGGVSGGPVFGFGPDTSMESRWIDAVAIRENPADNQDNRTIVAHGMVSIYGRALEMIAREFPDIVLPEELARDLRK